MLGRGRKWQVPPASTAFHRDGSAGCSARAEEEHAVRREQTVNAGEQCAARVLGEVKHDVAQEDHIETLVKGQRQLAQIGLAEVAELANLRFRNPVFADVVEVAHHVARRKTAIDLDAVITARLRALAPLRCEMSVPSMRMFQPASMGKCSSSSMASE